eukprot:5084976-Pyramimonas_sp.AAC.1
MRRFRRRRLPPPQLVWTRSLCLVAATSGRARPPARRACCKTPHQCRSRQGSLDAVALAVASAAGPD